MTRRLTVEWPDAAPFRDRAGALRLLATSDEADPTIDDPRNREALGRVDLVIGCGDLSPDRLCFMADAFRAPVVYVRGNHDRGGPWPTPGHLPPPSQGVDRGTIEGLALLGLPWPSPEREPALHDELAAWRQVLRRAGGSLVAPGRPPLLVFSHVPPRGAGDTPTDPYHVGFAAYRFVLDRLRPPLWIHGHSSLAAGTTWQVRHDGTAVVNVTGTVLIELLPKP